MKEEITFYNFETHEDNELNETLIADNFSRMSTSSQERISRLWLFFPHTTLSGKIIIMYGLLSVLVGLG